MVNFGALQAEKQEAPEEEQARRKGWGTSADLPPLSLCARRAQMVEARKGYLAHKKLPPRRTLQYGYA